MNHSLTDVVRQRQDPLRAQYRDAPEDARIRDHATTASAGSDPFHGTVIVGDSHERWSFGIHRAVGGDHDLPNPGDILCASLAACLDSTLRMLADRLGVRVEALEIAVAAIADVRGCLVVERGVPVGFQRIDVDIRLDAAPDIDPELVDSLKALAEQCCVILQTLRAVIPITTEYRQFATSTEQIH
jgi:uncharacterized OsmC-like protein